MEGRSRIRKRRMTMYKKVEEQDEGRFKKKWLEF